MGEMTTCKMLVSIRNWILMGATALALAITVGLFPGQLQEAHAADLSGGSIYFGEGVQEGWGLYTDATLTTPLLDGKDENWWVEANNPGVLYLQDFNYEVAQGSIAGLIIKKDTTIVCEGDNSVTHLGRTEQGGDITSIEMENNLTIKGSGTLSITVNMSNNGLSGIRLTANKTLTVSGATVEVFATGESTQSTSWGIVGTGGSKLVVENGARLRTVGGVPTNSNKGYGLYLISSDSFVTITGTGSSLIAQGNTMALLLKNEPVLNGSPFYGVGARGPYSGDDDDVDYAYWYPYEQWNTYCYQDDAQYPAQFVRFEEKAALTTTSLAPAEIGAPYNETLSATGSLPRYWSYDVRTYELPPGLVLDPHKGTISGTPTQAGSWTLVLDVSNYPFGQDSKQLTIVVSPKPSPVPLDDGNGGSSGGLAQAGDGSTLLLGILSVAAFVVAGSMLYIVKRRKSKHTEGTLL